MLSDAEMIDILKALADPNRLQLFKLLLYSDRTNSELMDETGLRQNLLSHHLTVLASCGLIQTHRSIGDARRYYFGADLRMAQQVFEWWQHHTPLKEGPLPALRNPRRVLFLCRHNSSRSLIAEALAHHLAAGALIAQSAGIEKGDLVVPSLTLRVLAERGVPADRLAVRTLHSLADRRFDYVITVCDIVHESGEIPRLPDSEVLHWSLPDPALEAQDEAQELAITHQLFDQIALRLTFFVQRLAELEAAGTSP